ncbi:MAG TPA: menaquinone biosynthesis protein, partial [Terriglobales bacterium]|nr:menaquinone biosynthesis protein [Terriglobales bacterium]
DLGVIPAIELARIPGLVALGGMGVAAQDGEGAAAEVRSILLLCRGPVAEVKTVALDRASRTSAALAQILLRQKFGARCAAVEGDRHWRQSLARADATLLIGDPALRLRVSGEAAAEGLAAYDLARVWREWTGLPFVFAVWGIRAPVWAAERGWLGERLSAALEEGLMNREKLVTLWAQRLALAPAEVRRYLQENVAYRITAAHREGLRRFFALAAEEKLIPAADMPPLVEVPGA